MHGPGEQAPVIAAPRRAAMDRHVAGLTSPKPHVQRAAVNGLEKMNLQPHEHKYVADRVATMGQKQWRQQQRFNAKIGKQIDRASLPSSGSKNVIPATRSGVGGPGKQAGSQLGFVAESLTGYREIQHIRQHPLAGSIALAGILPFGRIAKGVELGVDAARGLHAGEEAVSTAEHAAQIEKARNIPNYFERRQALKAVRRGPKRTAAQVEAHIAPDAAAARARAVKAATKAAGVPRVAAGEAPAELGGEVGRAVRQRLRPVFPKGTMSKEVISAARKEIGPTLKTLRKQNKELRSVEASKRFGKVASAQEAAKGNFEEFARAGAHRAGQMPTMVFHGLDILKPYKNEIQSHIDSLPWLPGDKQKVNDAFKAAWAGKVLDRGEQKWIERAFGRHDPKFFKEEVAKRGLGSVVADTLNIPRAVKSAGDFSWGLRQGLLAAGYNPKLWAQEYGPMFKNAVSESHFTAQEAALKADPEYALAKEKGGVAFTNPGEALNAREEAMPSQYAEHLHEFKFTRQKWNPVHYPLKAVSTVVRASDRAYVGPLNNLRLKLFKTMIRMAAKQGYHMNDKLYHDIGDVVNTLTGRGNLGKKLAEHRATINALIWSPGLVKSRVNMLNPYWYMKMEPFARKQATRALLQTASAVSTILFLAHQAGADVELDPRSANWGKIRDGNTRVDIMGGLGQYVHLAAVIATEQSKSSTTGKITNLTGKSFGTSPYDVGINFIEGKASPILSEGITLAKRNRFGQPLTVKGEIAQMTVPLLWNDIWDIRHKNPAALAAFAIPDIFGTGLQTYGPQPPKGSGGHKGSPENPLGGGAGSNPNLNPLGGSGGSSSSSLSPLG